MRKILRSFTRLISLILITPLTLAAVSSPSFNASFFAARAAESVTSNIPPPPVQSIARLTEQASRMIPRQEYPAALENIQKGLEIDPTYIPLWRLKALAHIALGQNTEADEALQVCLLRDPNDIEANVLILKNAMAWKDVNYAERVRRAATRLRGMDPALFSSALTGFMRGKDFPENVSLFLTAWNKSGNQALSQIRKVLGAYAGNHLQDAMSYLDEMAQDKNPIFKPATLDMLRRIVSEAGDPYLISGWNVERGELTHEETHYTLTARPVSDAFATLRVSESWRDIAATIDFPGTFPGGSRSLYLRHRPPHAFMRITLNDSALLVQERVPEVGLFTLCEIDPADLGGQPIRVILKGERLSLFAGGESLVQLPLPVSPLIADGSVALACENSTNANATAEFASFTTSRIDDHWLVLSGDKHIPLADIRAGGNATALLAYLGAGQGAGEELPTVLLAAVNSGLAVYGLLPEGSLDLEELRRPLARLPALLAKRIWSGAVVSPGPNTDLDAVAGLFQKMREAGQQCGLYVNEVTAGRLATYKGNLFADWLILGDKQNWAGVNLEHLDPFYQKLLFESNGSLTAHP